MLLLLASGWVLAYGGVFFLGFGGSRWTSDLAINYYKTVLNAV
jgi:type IV secretion system protein VirB6/type IV secretion system protein TrbL